jgi:DNA-binding NtrC family response regulator
MAKVLVVDDDVRTLSAIKKLLEYDDHSAVCVTSGAKAIDLLHTENFDAVFTDLEIGTPDGEAVARAARKIRPASCVYVCSASVHVEKAHAADACVFIPKPIDYDALHTRMVQCRSCPSCRAKNVCHGRFHRDGSD